ncbi:hypothetical protein EV667_2201 [Ancylobacter aquaticus]|uniref:Uncharacterized protein n=1 Tax=Ancylobacter aquaticus TaxID=100 RepID=A0A4R1I4B5_ANCAQ|nr:hypothetical protein [Ancylobacter aquaticus]TCK28200.1 hypothetical protein EV667_2201 [Ancylobacter aquaticus]
MLFLALELWPYLVAALAIGLATGWWSGCAPARLRTPAADTKKGAS